MSLKKLFVASLRWSVTDDRLRELFEPFGEVVEAKIARELNGRSRGYGFVTMRDPAAASAAVSALNASSVDGRIIHCAFSRPRSEK